MDKSWVKIYESNQLHRAEIVKAVLEDNNIATVILNKQSSSHVSLNTDTFVEVYTKNDNVVSAKYIIEKHNL